jgi:Taurine catabolism dioxygenase TauD, TfdA family
MPGQHPLVRQHPVTGEKALYVNQGFTRRIVGYKVEESEYFLKFLYDHTSKGADFQIRASYEPGTVVVWVCLSCWNWSRLHRGADYVILETNRTTASRYTLPLPTSLTKCGGIDAAGGSPHPSLNE